MVACLAPAPRLSRIITPALATEAVFSCASTRAVIDPSPVSCEYAKRNSSDVAVIPAPPPVTNHASEVPCWKHAVPACPTAPTSRDVYPVGRDRIVKSYNPKSPYTPALRPDTENSPPAHRGR